MNRPKITKEQRKAAMRDVMYAYKAQLVAKGKHIFASRHEILGVLDEEYDEFKAKVHDNATDTDVIDELLDIIVAAVHGIASIKTGKTDW